MNTIYVMGYSRSGSTLLGRLLAESHGGVFVGESVHVPTRRNETHQCSCGAPDLACPFWGPVLREISNATAAYRRLERGRTFRRRDMEDRFVDEWISAVYARAAALYPDRPLVDTSKRAAYGAAMLRQATEGALVWVIRDPRPVVRAQVALKPNPSITNPGRLMGGRSAHHEGAAWLRHNAHALLQFARYRGTRRLVRFSEFVTRRADPTLPSDLRALVNPNEPSGMVHHVLHGNPRTDVSK